MNPRLLQLLQAFGQQTSPAGFGGPAAGRGPGGGFSGRINFPNARSRLAPRGRQARSGGLAPALPQFGLRTGGFAARANPSGAVPVNRPFRGFQGVFGGPAPQTSRPSPRGRVAAPGRPGPELNPSNGGGPAHAFGQSMALSPSAQKFRTAQGNSNSFRF